MIKIGLTGGICTGKSTLLTIIQELGIKTWSADVVVHRFYKEDDTLKKLIKNLCFQYNVDGFESLKQKILSTPEILDTLEDNIHPNVRKDLNNFLKQNKDEQVVVCETPLLFENDLTSFFDEIWVTTVPESVQNERFYTRPQANHKVMAFLKTRQWDQRLKCEKADRVINMDRSLEVIKDEVKKYFKERVCSG